jgi:hypothetical protein
MTEKRLDSVLRTSARGSIWNAFAPRFGLVRFSMMSDSQLLPEQGVLDQLADALGAAPLVLVAVEFAADQDRVERAAVRDVVKICASTMLAPAAAQAPVMIDSRRGWSCASTVISVTPRIRACAPWLRGSCLPASASRMNSAWRI